MIRLILIILLHLLVVIGNLCGFFFLAYHGLSHLFGFSDFVPWYVGLACCSSIFYLSTTREECYLTRLENKMRRQLGLMEIKGFIKHYLLRRFW